MATRVVRGFNLDIDLSGDIDAMSEKRGINKSELVNRLLRAALEAERIQIAKALVHAGVGTAALVALTVLSFLL